MIRLSILVATVGRRNDKFVALMRHLMPLTKGLPIEVVAFWNNGERPIGHVRQALLEESRGEYVCFIDDDDWVPDWYCTEIMNALGRDYVGFELALFEKDKKMPRVFHDIKYGLWHEDDKGYYRGVTHLNPIKRNLALLGKFGEQGSGEDESWARVVAPHVKSQVYIDKVMYHYRHDSDETMFGGKTRPEQKYYQPDFTHPHFRYHQKSKLDGRM